MADITVTANNVGVVFPPTAGDPGKTEIYDYIAAVNLTPGLPVYIDANGKVGIADGNGNAPINRFRGITLESVKAGQVVSVLARGAVYGFDLSAQAYDAAVYVSDGAGVLADAAGTTTLQVGRVVPLADKDRTKVLLVTGPAG